MKILFTILLLSFGIESFCQLKDETIFLAGVLDPNYIISNRIKKVREEFSVEDGKKITKIFYFNRNGRIENINNIDEKGIETLVRYFLFNEREDVISIITPLENAIAQDTVQFHKEYSGNNLVKEILPYANIPLFHYYDEKNRRVRSENPYNYGGSKSGYRIVKNVYDDSNRIIHVTDCVYNDKKDSVIQLISDRSIKYINQKIKQIEEKINNEVSLQNRGNVTYDYDSSGRLISMVSENMASEYYTYNLLGLVTSKITVTPIDFDGRMLKMNYKYSYEVWD